MITPQDQTQSSPNEKTTAHNSETLTNNNNNKNHPNLYDQHQNVLDNIDAHNSGLSEQKRRAQLRALRTQNRLF